MVEVVIGICAIALSIYEIAWVAIGFFYHTDEPQTLDGYDGTSTAADYLYQLQFEQPADSTKTVNWYDQDLSLLENTTTLPNDE